MPAQKYKFVKAPPKRKMRKASPESAPRLYEWLLDEGFVESVPTIRNKRMLSAIGKNLRKKQTGIFKRRTGSSRVRRVSRRR